MTAYRLIFVLLSFTACGDKDRTRLITEDLKYTAYSWRMEGNNYELYVAHYFHIDKDGNFSIMRHDKFMDNPKYFSGKISDAIREMVNNTLFDTTFKNNYFQGKEKIESYNGFTYVMDYVLNKSGNRKTIQFLPLQSPPQLQKLASEFDTLIYLSATKQIPAFSIDNYIKELKKDSADLPFPKKEPPNVELKKYNN